MGYDIEKENGGVWAVELICPICGNALGREPGHFSCESGHSFDIARQGYVNLLAVQQKHSAAPGDTLEQVRSRRAFLNGGFYEPISNALMNAARKYDAHGALLDVGCGEGYYCAGLSKALNLELTGVDISKEAVRYAAGAYKDGLWLCATAAHLPVRAGSADVLTSLFAVTLPEEFSRVLKKDGLFLQVLAAQDHLLGLKSIIYDNLIFKDKDSVPELPGFALLESIPVRFTFMAEGEQVMNLLSMTPHVYRIGKAGAQRLRETPALTDTASCVINVYRRV